MEMELNPRQKEAVEYTEGPLLIIAGAGAGKTKVITERIAYLMRVKNVPPEQILAVTFTNKAANEMKERVRVMLEKNTFSFDGMPFISTFHSLCVFILRNEAAVLGLKKSFIIFDKDDSKRAVREAMREINPDLIKQFDPSMIVSLISKEKNDGKNADMFGEGRRDEFGMMVFEIWKRYEKTLQSEAALDFDDLLVKAVGLLKKNAEVRKRYESQWKYIHIDEYHDTNAIQYELVKILSDKNKNIAVVGDVDQSIYSWRGADIRNIIRFEKDFPGTKTILLEENYRSTKNILDVANAVISKNKNRFEKNLFTKKASGEKISVYEAYDEADEANFVTEKIRAAISSGTIPEEIAVLYRANFQSRALEESCLSKNIPYMVLGTRFFERKEVKDVLAYMKAARNPESISEIKRVINLPPRGIGKVSIVKIFSGKEEDLSDSQKSSWQNFKLILKKIENEMKINTPSKVIAFILKQTGLEKMLTEEGEEGMERIENVMELSTFASRYDGLELPNGIDKLLEDAALASDQDSIDGGAKGVRLSTIHASKGLEFEVVFVTGLEQDLFPHKPMDKNSKRDDEEERRLFYVALTRAKRKIYLSHTGTRMVFGSRQWNAPSEFLFDLPEDLIEQEEKTEGGGKIIYFDI